MNKFFPKRWKIFGRNEVKVKLTANVMRVERKIHVAIERRKPPPGCVHHTDRGSQYAAQGYREALLRYSLVGSTGRRGNPCDNPVKSAA